MNISLENIDPKTKLRAEIISALKDVRVLFNNKIGRIPEDTWEDLDLEYGEIEPAKYSSKIELLKKITALLSVNFAKERFLLALKIHKELHDEYITAKRSEQKLRRNNILKKIIYCGIPLFIFVLLLNSCPKKNESDLHKQHSEDVTRLEKQNSVLKENIRELQQLVIQCKASLEKYSKILDENKKSIDNNNNAIASLKSQIKQLETEISFLKKQNTPAIKGIESKNVTH